MNFRQLRCLRGPNGWAACPIIEAALDFGSESDWTAEQIRQTMERLGSDLLGPTNVGEASLLQLAEAFGRLALKLQGLAGNAVSFAAARPTIREGLFRSAVEFAEEPVGQASTETAWHLLQAAREGKPLLLEDALRRLRDLAYQQRLPASTAVIYHAARARGIPAVRLSPEYGRFLRLGQGAKQHRCQASEPDSVSAVARTASTDKYLAKQLLQAAGVPVPVGRLVSSAEEAWTAAEELGLPVAIKPQDSDLATGVSLDLRSREQVEAGFRSAHEHSTWVLVERFAPGVEHRVLVVADRVSAVTRIDPPHVVGDGVSTVAELVDRVNQDPRRGDEGSGAPLSKLKIDDVAHAVLAMQDCTITSVPPAGKRVLVRRNPPYFKNGGNLVDLTDSIHPSTAAHAVAAAQALQLRVAGLDVVALDIGKPLEEQAGVVVEINAGPGLWLHMAPWADAPRPIGEDIVASLFPPGSDGRIPVAALLGDATGNVKKHLAALLTLAGFRVGIASEARIVVGERRWSPEVNTPQERAGLLMQNPTVDVALLETSPRELLRAGFGNDRCDVAILMDPRASEDVTADATDPEADEFLQAVQHMLGEIGVLVHPSEREANRIEAGDRALFVVEDAIVLTHGTEEPRSLGKRPGKIAVREMPGLLAALAAGLILGLNEETLKTYLHSLS